MTPYLWDREGWFDSIKGGWEVALSRLFSPEEAYALSVERLDKNNIPF